MLTSRQKDTIDNWEAESKSKKDVVRNKCANAIADLGCLRNLPPGESREIIQEAIKRCDDELTSDGHVPIKAAYENEFEYYEKSQSLLIRLICILYNGVEEDVFGYSFNQGVKEAVKWWVGHSQFSARSVYDNLECKKEKNENYLLSPNAKIRRERPASPPNDEKERLERLFLLHGKYSLVNSGFLDRLTDRGIESIDIEQMDKNIKYIEENIDRIDDMRAKLDKIGYESIKYFNESQGDWVEEDDQQAKNRIELGLLYSFKEAKQTERESRRIAEYIANSVRHPRNTVWNTRGLPPWYKREFIELHRDFLERNDNFPTEEKIPEYKYNHPRAPYPPALNLCNWVDTKSPEDFHSN